MLAPEADVFYPDPKKLPINEPPADATEPTMAPIPVPLSPPEAPPPVDPPPTTLLYSSKVRPYIWDFDRRGRQSGPPPYSISVSADPSFYSPPDPISTTASRRTQY